MFNKKDINENCNVLSGNNFKHYDIWISFEYWGICFEFAPTPNLEFLVNFNYNYFRI